MTDTTKGEFAPHATQSEQRLKNQAAIDLIERWLNETPTPEEIEAERKSLAYIMVDLCQRHGAYPLSETEPQTEAAAEYAKRNPLGGPARVFEAMASRIRAGEDENAVLADYGLQYIKNADPQSGSADSIRARTGGKT